MRTTLSMVVLCLAVVACKETHETIGPDTSTPMPVPSTPTPDQQTAQSHAGAGPTCENLVGVWHNDLKSTLTIASVDATSGRVTGTYRSPSGTTGDDNPLEGWRNAAPADPKHPDNTAVVSFSVRWGKYGSITSWSGTCSGSKLFTVWNLARANSDFGWDHILTGSDTFTPGAP